MTWVEGQHFRHHSSSDLLPNQSLQFSLADYYRYQRGKCCQAFEVKEKYDRQKMSVSSHKMPYFTDHGIRNKILRVQVLRYLKLIQQLLTISVWERGKQRITSDHQRSYLPSPLPLLRQILCPFKLLLLSEEWASPFHDSQRSVRC